MSKLQSRHYFAAAKLIDERGLNRGWFSNGNGRLCAVGALRVALSGDATKKINGKLPASTLWTTLTSFNDSTENTADEVCMALEFLGQMAKDES